MDTSIVHNFQNCTLGRLRYTYACKLSVEFKPDKFVKFSVVWSSLKHNFVPKIFLPPEDRFWASVDNGMPLSLNLQAEDTVSYQLAMIADCVKKSVSQLILLLKFEGVLMSRLLK